RSRLAQDQQEQLVFPILDEQVLCMPARDVAAQRLRIPHGMEGRMLDGGGVYRQTSKVVEQVFRRGRHGSYGIGGGLVSPPSAIGKPPRVIDRLCGFGRDASRRNRPSWEANRKPAPFLCKSQKFVLYVTPLAGSDPRLTGPRRRGEGSEFFYFFPL